MAMRTGEKYRCPNPHCGCEIEVTQGAGSEGGIQSPRCCCGKEMEKLT